MAAESTMISAAINVLSTAIGFTCGIIYDHLIDSFLLDGELVDERLHQIFVRNLREVNFRLRSQSLKDFNASYILLEEGKALISTENYDRDSARECFKKSREQATNAFSDKSLSIEVRIVAIFLRVTARIYESGLDEGTTAACIQALKDLHTDPQIQKMFVVFLEGGLKSKFLKSQRTDHIMSILFLNHALFSFCCQYEYNYRYLAKWPRINLNDDLFHPIRNADKVLAKISRTYKLVQQVNKDESFWEIFTSRRHFVVNSRDEVIVVTRGDKMTVIYSADKIKEIPFTDPTETLESGRCSLTVDSEDNIYVVRWRKVRGKNGTEKEDLVLYIFDENYTILKDPSILDFIDAREYKHIDIAVNANRALMVIASRDNQQVYVCDNRGNKKVTFRQDGDWLLMNLSISHDEIMTVSDDHDRRVVRIHYLRDGTLKHTIPEAFPPGREAKQGTFCSETYELHVLIYDKENDHWFRCRYSKTRACENKTRSSPMKNPEEYWWKNNMPTLSNTGVAVGNKIAFF